MSSTTATADTTTATTTWEIPAFNLDLFRGKIDQANRRLYQAGNDHRFEVTYEPFTKQREENGVVYHDQWVRATLAGPLHVESPTHQFAATLVQEEAGWTVHTAPGVNLGGYAPREDNQCDHCQTRRSRNRIYLVRSRVTGELLQVGNSCLELYTGINPRGLWVLELVDDLDEVVSRAPDPVSRRDTADVSIDSVIAWAWGYSNEGRAYISGARAQEHEVPSTGSEVRRALYMPPRPNPRAPQDYERYLEAMRIGEQLVTEQPDLLAAIRQSVLFTSEDTDYGRNLRVILDSPSGVVSFRNVAVVASLVSVYVRQLEREQEREAKQAVASAQGFIGEVGERVRDFELTLSTVREWEGQYGWTTLLVGHTPSGHIVKWFASGRFDYEVGQVLKIEAATIKDHDEFRGQDQTVITRAKIDTFEPRAQQARHDLAAGGDSEVIAERWFNSKKERKRFDGWLAANPLPVNQEGN